MATSEEQVRAAIERERTRRRQPALLLRNVGLERGAGVNPGPSGDFSRGPPNPITVPATLGPEGPGIGSVQPAETRPVQPAQTAPVSQQPQRREPLGATTPDPSGTRLPSDATITGDVGTQATPAQRGPNIQRPLSDRTLTGDVGTRATSAGGAAGAVTPATNEVVSQARAVSNALGVLGPEDAPTAEAPARVDAATNQEFRDTVVAQQAELFDQYQQAQQALANATTDPTSEGIARRNLLKRRVDSLASALGQSTQGGASNFGANRQFDRGVTVAGIGADTDVAVANASNLTNLGIAEGRNLVDLFTGITSANATERGAALRAAADSAGDPIDRFNLAFAGSLFETDPFTAFQVANGQALDPEQIETDSLGNPVGIRTRTGQIAPLPTELINKFQELNEQGLR